MSLMIFVCEIILSTLKNRYVLLVVPNGKIFRDEMYINSVDNKLYTVEWLFFWFSLIIVVVSRTIIPAASENWREIGGGR